MAQTIKLKRSATSGAVPTTSALALGEMAINTHDGKVYIKKNDGAESVVEVGADQTPAELLTAIKTVDGSGSGLDADLLDGQQGSYYLNTSTKLFKSGAEIAGSQDLNTYRTTGYYAQDSNADATSGSNYPVLAAGILEVITGDQGNGLQTEQRYSQYNNNDKYVRHYYNGNWTAWAKQWNSANDGSGSGLDADLLDGQQGSYYYPASNPNGYTNDQTAAEILTAIKTVDGSGSGLDADTVDGHHAYESQILDTRDSGDVTPDGFGDKRVSYSFTDDIAGSTHTWDSVITVKGWSDAYRAWQITSNSSNDDTDQNLYFRSGRNDTWGSLRTVWDSGNDGSGSGLDADLLDGVQGSGYVNTTGTQTVGGVKNFTSNVGIGTSAPSAKLEINGGVGVATTGGTLIVRQDGNTNSDGIALTSSNATSHRFWKDSGGKLNIGPSSLPSALVQDLSGNVGIGTSSPPGKLTISNNGAEGIEFFPANQSGLNTTQHYNRSGTAYVVNNVIASEHRFNNGTSEKMRLNSAGHFLHSTTSTQPTAGGTSILGGNASLLTQSHAAGTSPFGSFQQYKYNSSIIGSVSRNGNTGVFFVTSSDGRLKENVKDSEDAGSKIDAIQVRQYDWKVDGSHQDYGMIAQELVEVAPEAVSVPEGSEDMMGVDYSKLVPMLIKEIQSLRTRVAQLEDGE